MKRLLIILTLAGLPCTPFAQTRLTLDACIEQAEANNKALAAADRQLAAAQFDFRSARANFFPSFSATGTGLYSTADGGLDIAGGALPVLGVDGMPTGGTALFPGLNLAYEVGWVYGGGITLEPPLNMGGKVRTGYRMARIGSEMAEQNRRLTRSEVIVSTSRAYASVIRAREIPRKGITGKTIFLNYGSWPLYAAGALKRLPGGYDAVFCFNTSPVLMCWPAIRYAKKHHIPFTNYVLDLWPENLYSVLPVKNRFMRWVAQSVSDSQYRRCDRLLA